MKLDLEFETIIEANESEYRIIVSAIDDDAWIEQAWLREDGEDVMEVSEDVISMLEDEVDLIALVAEETAGCIIDKIHEP